MNNLKKVNLVELNAKELRETQGGWTRVIEFQVSMVKWFWDNKNTRFVKDTFAGNDAYSM